MKYVIRITNSQNPCWVAPWTEGDPPRTIVFKNAQQFDSRKIAEIRLEQVKKTHPLRPMYYIIKPIT
jgi:hypothetical protein